MFSYIFPLYIVFYYGTIFSTATASFLVFIIIEWTGKMIRKTLSEMENDSGKKLIIDIRGAEEFSTETYPGAVNISLDDFENEFENRYTDDERDAIRKDTTIYLICYTGLKSDIIADSMQKKGYRSYSLDEGYRCIMRRNVQSQIPITERNNGISRRDLGVQSQRA